MRSKKSHVLLALATFVIAAAVPLHAKHPIAFDDLVKIHRISDPQVSPDGRWVAYVQGDVNLEGNKTIRHIWLVPTEGGESRQLTRGEGSDTRPRWSPDGKSLAFMSTRGGKSQVWVIPVAGGEARQVTSLSTEADGVWEQTRRVTQAQGAVLGERGAGPPDFNAVFSAPADSAPAAPLAAGQTPPAAAGKAPAAAGKIPPPASGKAPPPAAGKTPNDKGPAPAPSRP